MNKLINWIINKIKILRITIADVEEIFRDSLYDECTMVMESYGKCHDFPCDDCVLRTYKEIKNGTFEI